VDAIRVVWSENGTTPPSPTDEKDKGWFSEHKPVFYDTYSTTSLNNRFVPPVGEEGQDNGKPSLPLSLPPSLPPSLHSVSSRP